MSSEHRGPARCICPLKALDSSVGGGLTIGCRGCGALHTFGRRKVLRGGPAPLTLVSLGARPSSFLPGAHLRETCLPARYKGYEFRPSSFVLSTVCRGLGLSRDLQLAVDSVASDATREEAVV